MRVMRLVAEVHCDEDWKKSFLKGWKQPRYWLNVRHPAKGVFTAYYTAWSVTLKSFEKDERAWPLHPEANHR